MSLTPGARKELVQRLVASLAVMSSEEWEPLGHRIVEVMASLAMKHRGQTISGNPVGHTVDSYSARGTTAVECSVDQRYFDELVKPQSDFDHAKRKHPQAETIFLLSTQIAGPSAYAELANWENEIAVREGINVAVLDAREIAEFIVDTVLPSTPATEKLKPYLHVLQALENEYAATHAVPFPEAGSIERPDLENELNQLLDERHVVLLAGMSGLGKSQTAIAVAHSRRARHDWAIWVTGLRIHSVSELQAVDILQKGQQTNLLGMLASRSCLIVLDDLQTTGSLSHVLTELRAKCSPRSHVLLTSQISVEHEATLPMPFLDEALSRKLLESGAETPCPDNEFRTIWAALDGHPLALRMMNGLALNGTPWDEVASDAARVGDLPILERTEKLANLIVNRSWGAIDKSLAFFVWVNSPRAQQQLALRTLSAVRVNDLRRLGFVAGDQSDTIRLHEIVWACALTLSHRLNIPREEFGVKLDQFVQTISSDDAGTIVLNHLSRLHQPLLNRLVHSNERRDGHLYAWLHHPGPGPVDLSVLPSPTALAEEITREKQPSDFSVQTVAELAESVLHSRTKSAGDMEAIAADLLRPFNVLVSADRVSGAAKHHVRHHRAKALKRLRRYREAIVECETLLEEIPNAAATRLLLARILTELPAEVEVDKAGETARTILLQLLTEAKADPRRASISVILACGELLRRNALSINFGEVLTEFGELFESFIISGAQRGLEQAIFCFGALGSEWARADAAAFRRIYSKIPLPSSTEAFPEDELVSWGEILKAAARETQGEESVSLLEQSLNFFRRSTRRYSQTHAADVLSMLGRGREAADLLDKLLANDHGAKTDTWVLQRMAEAQLAMGNETLALKYSSEACHHLKERNRHSPYLLGFYAIRLSAANHKPEAESVLNRLHEWLDRQSRTDEWSEWDRQIRTGVLDPP